MPINHIKNKKVEEIKKSTPKRKAHFYLTKRILKSVARRSVIQAATETMGVIGYNVIVRKGWVVKKYTNGNIERIAPIQIINRSGAILLD